jgi:hypothetical protein
MIVGRCPSALSSHKLQAKSKKSQPLSGAPHRALCQAIQTVGRCAQDDDFVGVLTKNIPNELALMGLHPGLSSVSDHSDCETARSAKGTK